MWNITPFQTFTYDRTESHITLHHQAGKFGSRQVGSISDCPT